MDEKIDSVISPVSQDVEDIVLDTTLRPKTLNDYIGQETVKNNLYTFITAAKQRQEPLEHVLIYGPPGLGKTTLANVIANEMGVNIRTTSGPAIERSGDIAAILTSLQPGDILFIDEIHRLNRQIEEILYSAMEDYSLDIIIGKGPSARTLRLDLPKFTLIGATTRIASLSSPLRDRFGMLHRLEFYQPKEVEQILARSARILNISLSDEAKELISHRARRTPRIANRLLKRIRDFAQVDGKNSIDQQLAVNSLENMQIDRYGLDEIDRKILLSIIEKFKGGPVGLSTVAASVAEEKETVEDVYEPYLIQLGLIERTSRGRKVTDLAYQHLGISNKNDI